jgi:hypothetical protein
MSEILSNIVVEQTSINFSPNNNNLNVTPEAIQLNIFTGAAPGAGQSSNGELLYNNANLIDGVPNTSFASGNLTLGNVANIKITGGTNGYVLQTDGTGNLDWTAMTGGGGNGAPGGSNTQIQYNDSGLFGGTAGFTFNEVSGNVNIPGNLIVVGNITGTITGSASNANYANFAGIVVNSNQSNITSIGNLISLKVEGTTSIQQASEKVTVYNYGSNGTVNFDILDQAIILYTGNSIANTTVNIRGNSSVTFNNVATTNSSITCTFINRNAASAFYINNVQIDSVPITINWSSGNAPSAGIINAYNQYTFNIIKTNANVYTVFGVAGGYY